MAMPAHSDAVATPSRVRIAPGLRQGFATPFNAILSMLVVAACIAGLVPLTRWALTDAVWRGSPADCRADGAGACWAFVGEKLDFILFGLYPPGERWRAAAATIVLFLLIACTAAPRLWRRSLLLVWGVGLAVALWLMRGGEGTGLVHVPTRAWGGLPVTIMLTAVGLAAGFPIAIVLALARRSRRRLPRLLAGAFVEVVRGVPLIAVLYVAALVFPLALPTGLEVDKLFLAQAGIAVFASAYLAEAVRAALQIIPRGQREAALALGLRRWQATRLVILPQALRVAIPSFISIAMGFFQDTSLVVILGLFDLLNTARLAAQDPEWLGFHTEAYVFAALIYFVGSAALSQYGLWLERRLGTGRRGAPSRATPAVL